MKKHLATHPGSTVCGAAAKPDQLRVIDQFIHIPPAEYPGDRLACLREEYTRALRSKSLHQRWNSSSVLSNLAEEAQRVALAKFLDRLDRWVL